jgi:Fe-S-cluster-containing dehydrogenase component/DMSO reductase anchor subunit
MSSIASKSNRANSNSLLGDSILGELLQEQHSWTAIETFSNWHERNQFLNHVYQELMPATSPGPGEQYAFEVDLDACSGCKACVVACHSLNGLSETEAWRRVGTLHSQSDPLPIVQHVTSACHHCVEPGCLLGCPVQAYEKDLVTGIVRHLDDQCFGCKYCTMMCPYEVPQYLPEVGIVRKCDMCSQRLSADQAPACVQACPNQAIRITKVQVAEIEASANTTSQNSAAKRLVPTAPENWMTLPSTVYKTTRESLQGPSNPHITVAATHDGLHEGHLPLVAMLTFTQLGVGGWIWAALLSTTPSYWRGATVSKQGDGIEPVLGQVAVASTILVLIGLTAALAHLGRPYLFFRSFLGWRTSWLSREAILFGVFAKSAIVTTFVVEWSRIERLVCGTDRVPFVSDLHRVLEPLAPLFVIATAILGVISVASSAMIYIATKRRLWSFRRTMTDMMATSLALGGGMLLCLFSYAGIQPSTLWKFAVFVLPLVAFSSFLFDLTTYLVQGNHTGYSADSHLGLSFLRGRLLCRSCSKLLALLVAIALLGWVAMFFGLVLLGFGCLMVKLAIHRWLYFSSVVYPRMPGAIPCSN